MDTHETVERLARTLGEAWITSGPRAWEEQSEARRAGARHLAAALLPVVREIAAEELREAAEEGGVGMRPDFPGAALLRAVKTGDLHARADSLTELTP